MLLKLKGSGYSESTLGPYGRRLRFLARFVNLDDPEAVKQFIASQDSWGLAYCETMVNAYHNYVILNGLSWVKPTYRRGERLPAVMTSEQVNALIASARRKYALAFSILRDTGLRPVELSHLTLRHIDMESGVINPETAKHGRARSLKLEPKTLAMLKTHVGPGLDDRLFPDTSVLSHAFQRTRDRAADKLKDPNLLRFRLYDLRHYYATTLYRKTKDILYVMRQLGHKRIENTLIYTHLVAFNSEEYTCKVAKSVDEATQLIEQSFEYVTDVDGVKLFRKPK